MKIYIGTDHRGYELKEALIGFLTEMDYEVVDKGAFSYNEGDDYPDYIRPVAKEVSESPQYARGIIIGASGQGEAVLANRYKGVRAVVFYGGSEEILKFSREDNDANILSLGARFLTEDEAKSAVKIWLETEFPGAERHIRRIEKIDE